MFGGVRWERPLKREIQKNCVRPEAVDIFKHIPHPHSPLSYRSRLADFFTNCQPESRSVSSCLKENYADCLLAYSGLIGKTGEKWDGRKVWLTNTQTPGWLPLTLDVKTS